MKRQKNFHTELRKLRLKVDVIDAHIVSLLEKRLHISETVGKIKNILNLPMTDPRREAGIIHALVRKTNRMILRETIKSLYTQIFELSKKVRMIQPKKSFQFSRIGVIGLGLIGGSIIKSIKTNYPSIVVNTIRRKSKDIRDAKHENLIDHEFESLKELMKNSDCIIIASPIETIIPYAKQIAKEQNAVKRLLIVFDCGSVKNKIAQAFEQLTTEHIEFVPTHPMAGSEKSGFLHSQSSMFINQPWIITPHRKNKKSTITKVSQCIKGLGSNPVLTDPITHDREVAVVSHLVFLMASLLFDFTQKKHARALRFAGSGFKSATRLAMDNGTMHHQIFKNNEENINTAFREFIRYCQNFSHL